MFSAIIPPVSKPWPAYQGKGFHRTTGSLSGSAVRGQYISGRSFESLDLISKRYNIMVINH